MDSQRILNAIRALKALTDEEYNLVREAVNRVPSRTEQAAPVKGKGPLTGRAPKGSTLASERAKKAWRTRKRNQRKRETEAAGGNEGGSAANTPAED